jgi:23S rRNA G2069 N7-methylase RlmK/C1962 C5-methylase RlmI
LKPQGKLIFSTNNRQFKMKYELKGKFKGKEITHQTLPMDFRNKKIHRCYLFESEGA